MEVLLPVLCALLAGAALVWFVFAAPARSRAERAEARLEEIDRTTGSRFAELASDVLKSNSDSFLQLVSERFQSHRVEAEKDLEARGKAVEALVAPIRDELKKVEERAQQLERSRVDAYRSVTEQVRQLAQAQSDLRSETGRLVQALRRPQGAGRWGEHQLRNVLEIAGMVEACRFRGTAHPVGRGRRAQARRGHPSAWRKVGRCGCEDAAAGLSRCGGSEDG